MTIIFFWSFFSIQIWLIDLRFINIIPIKWKHSHSFSVCSCLFKYHSPCCPGSAMRNILQLVTLHAPLTAASLFHPEDPWLTTFIKTQEDSTVDQDNIQLIHMDIVGKESDIWIQINNAIKTDHYQPLHINLHIVKIQCTILQSKDLVHFTWILKSGWYHYCKTIRA